MIEREKLQQEQKDQEKEKEKQIEQFENVGSNGMFCVACLCTDCTYFFSPFFSISRPQETSLYFSSFPMNSLFVFPFIRILVSAQIVRDLFMCFVPLSGEQRLFNCFFVVGIAIVSLFFCIIFVVRCRRNTTDSY